MMNRQLKPLLLAASAVLLATACNDDNNGVDISRPIDLHLAPAAPLTAETRAAIDAPNFDSDDVVGLYLAWATDATAETGTAINASLVENTKWCNGQFEGEPLYWQNTVSYHTIYAYYPHTANVTSDYKVAVSIKQDQNSETAAADYEASDVLWAKRTDKAQNNLQLPLGHRMSLVTVTLKNAQGNTKVVKDAGMEILGAAFKPIDADLRRQLNLGYGLEVTGVSGGKMGEAGIRKGFIILKANGEPMKEVDDLERVMKAATQTPEQTLFISGMFPSGKRASYAVDLSQE